MRLFSFWGREQAPRLSIRTDIWILLSPQKHAATELSKRQACQSTSMLGLANIANFLALSQYQLISVFMCPYVFFKSSCMCICYPFLPFSCATRFPERTYLFVNSFGGLEAFLWSSSLNHPLTPICEGVRSHTTALSHKRIQHNVLDEHFNSKLQIYYIYQLSGIHTARNIWTTLPSITFHPVNIAGID